LSYALIISFLLTVAIHLPMMIHDPLIDRDDHLLIEPLANVHSFREYLEKLSTGKILDVQPLRDLSFWLDIHLIQRLGFGTFHLTNVLVWMACLALSAKVFRHQIKNPAIASASLILLAVHPCMADTVAWVSARKHLLACFFALIVTLWVLDEKRQSRSLAWKIPLNFLLSLLSQPIHILLPLWIGLHARLARSSVKFRAALVCLPFAGCIAAVNFLYYRSSHYTAVAMAQKFQGVSPLIRLGDAALAMGRYFFQLLIPLWVASDYSTSSVRNIIGLFLLPLFIWIAIKKLGAAKAVPWLVYTFLPLLWLALARTNIFVSDSYLLLPATGFFVLSGSIVETLPRPALSRRWRAACVVLFAVIVLGLGAFSEQIALTWRSDDAVWENVFNVERSEFSFFYIGLRLVDQKKIPLALQLAEKLMESYPRSTLVTELYAKAIFFNPDYDIDTKLEKLHRISEYGAAPIFYGAELFAEKKEFHKAYVLSQLALAQGPAQFGPNFEEDVAKSYSFCLKVAKLPDCDAMVERERKFDPRWMEEKFTARLPQPDADPETKSMPSSGK
jgi:hypothetical protein